MRPTRRKLVNLKGWSVAQINTSIHKPIVNSKHTRRTHAKDMELQGSVWSSLKCTAMMDTLNKTVMSNSDLQYFYKGDKSIPIGVRGMVDDTLGISKCGNQAVALNAVINSFIETQRLTLP